MAGSDQRPEPAHGASVEEITEDIERTREDLGETVQALTNKLDVKGRVTDAAETARADVVDAVTDDTGSIKPALPAAGAVLATAAILLGVILWRRHRQGAHR